MSESNNHNIGIYVHRTPHVTETDFQFLNDKIRRDPNIHIYAPEVSGWDQEFRSSLISIANGDVKTYLKMKAQTDPGSSWWAVFDALYASRMPLEIFDVTREEMEGDEILSGFGKSTFDLTTITATELVNDLRMRMQRGAQFLEKRDTIIARNINEKLPGIIDGHKRLRSLGQVGLLMTLGDNHQLVDGFLREYGFTVETNGAVVLNPHEYAIDMYLHNLEPTDDDVVRAAAMSVLRGFISHQSTIALRETMNSALSDIQESDIDDILDIFKKYGAKGVNKYIVELLNAKNLNNSGLTLRPDNF